MRKIQVPYGLGQFIISFITHCRKWGCWRLAVNANIFVFLKFAYFSQKSLKLKKSKNVSHSVAFNLF